MKDVLKAAFKKAGYKIDNKTILAESFFVLQGLFAGIALKRHLAHLEPTWQ